MKMEKFAYIGCRTTKERKARGKGISVYKVDGDNWGAGTDPGRSGKSFLSLSE